MMNIKYIVDFNELNSFIYYEITYWTLIEYKMPFKSDYVINSKMNKQNQRSVVTPVV